MISLPTTRAILTLMNLLEKGAIIIQIQESKYQIMEQVISSIFIGNKKAA